MSLPFVSQFEQVFDIRYLVQNMAHLGRLLKGLAL